MSNRTPLKDKYAAARGDEEEEAEAEALPLPTPTELATRRDQLDDRMADETGQILDYWREKEVTGIRLAALDAIKTWRTSQQLDAAAETLLAAAEKGSFRMKLKATKEARPLLKDAREARHQAVEQAEKVDIWMAANPGGLGEKRADTELSDGVQTILEAQAS